MRNDSVSSSEDEKKSVVEPEAEGRPSTPTLREQVFFGIKLFAIGGIIFGLFWFVETSHSYY